MISLKKVLLLYKLSADQIYFSGRKTSLPGNNNPALKKETAHFKKAHDEHYSSLKRVEKIFKEHKVSYTKRRRGRKIDYSKFDLIVTVGGVVSGRTGINTLTRPKGRTEAPGGRIGEANGVNGCRTTKTVKCVTEAVRLPPSALSTAVKRVASYWFVSGLKIPTGIRVGKRPCSAVGTWNWIATGV